MSTHSLSELLPTSCNVSFILELTFVICSCALSIRVCVLDSMAFCRRTSSPCRSANSCRSCMPSPISSRSSSNSASRSRINWSWVCWLPVRAVPEVPGVHDGLVTPSAESIVVKGNRRYWWEYYIFCRHSFTRRIFHPPPPYDTQLKAGMWHKNNDIIIY